LRIRLKGLAKTRKKLASGKYRDYYYAWRGGPAIDGVPGTPEFIAAYNAAVSARLPHRKGNLASLIDSYQDSEAFLGLAAKSKKDYRRILASICEKFGDCPVEVLQDKRVRGDFLAWRDEIARNSPRQADYTISVFARVLSWAKDRAFIAENPLERPKRVWKGSRAEKVWSDEDESKFLAVASPQLALALLLAVWTGQRQGDLLRLTWKAYDGEFIRLRQSKTSRSVEILVGAPLKAALGATPKTSPFIIASDDNRPYTSDGFRASWSKICKRAGIKGLTFHDLRGTAVTRMAQTGCTELEIAAVTGHAVSDVRSILDKHYYSRDPSIAKRAIQKLETRTKSANQPANRPE
jgi:integrase